MSLEPTLGWVFLWQASSICVWFQPLNHMHWKPALAMESHLQRSRSYTSMGISCNEIMCQKHIFLHQQPLLIKLASMHHQLLPAKMIDTFDNHHSWDWQMVEPWSSIVHCYQNLTMPTNTTRLSFNASFKELKTIWTISLCLCFIKAKESLTNIRDEQTIHNDINNMFAHLFFGQLFKK